MTAPRPTRNDITEAFRRLFLAVEPGANPVGLRREDVQKIEEITGLFEIIGAIRSQDLVVDAAGGKGSVGLLAAELLGARRVVLIEREAAHAALARAAARRSNGHASIEIRETSVEESSSWPDSPDVVIALHACGPASDTVLDAAIAHGVRKLFLAPCCYADAVPFAARARAICDANGVPRHAEVRRRAIVALIDAERTLRLEAAGYETVVSPFVPPTVSPHHLVWRARRSCEPNRMNAAIQSLARLRGD